MKKIPTILVLAIVLSVPQLILAQGAIFLSSLSPTPTGSNAVGGDSWLAAGFITGINASGYSLNSVQLGMANAFGNASGFTVMVYTEVGVVGANPGNNLGSLNGSNDPTTGGVFTYTPTANITLSPSTVYFIVTTAATTVANGAYEWSTSSFPPNSNGWGDLNSVLISNNGLSGWSTTPYLGIAQFAITATPVPEPSAELLFSFGGILLLCFSRWKPKVVE